MGIHLPFIVTVVSLVLSVCDAKDTCSQQSNVPNPCIQSCTKNDTICPPEMNCGKATSTCQQFCLEGSPCGLLQCGSSVKKCEQSCLNCPKETKLTCSSETCEQICSGKDCTMECTDKVKMCKQTCIENAKCSLTCGKNTMCVEYCSNATCKVEKPVVPPVTSSSCSEETCTRNCTGNCQEILLSCPKDIKMCNLVCNNGCEMHCNKTVTICSQQCLGNIPCRHICESKTCRIKKANSAADNFHNHTIFLFIISATCLLFINN